MSFATQAGCLEIVGKPAWGNMHIVSVQVLMFTRCENRCRAGHQAWLWYMFGHVETLVAVHNPLGNDGLLQHYRLVYFSRCLGIEVTKP